MLPRKPDGARPPLRHPVRDTRECAARACREVWSSGRAIGAIARHPSIVIPSAARDLASSGAGGHAPPVCTSRSPAGVRHQRARFLAALGMTQWWPHAQRHPEHRPVIPSAARVLSASWVVTRAPWIGADIPFRVARESAARKPARHCPPSLSVGHHPSSRAHPHHSAAAPITVIPRRSRGISREELSAISRQPSGIGTRRDP